MYRYTSYIMKQVAYAAAVVAVSLTGIVWLTQALRFVDYIITRGISFSSFLELTLLMLPSLMLYILPFAVLIAVVHVYYRLLMDSELLVLSSAGLSHAQIAAPGVRVGLFATLIAYVISLYILPLSYREFKDMQVFLRDNYASLLLQEEVFNSPVEGLTVYVQRRTDEGMLHGIIVHDSRDRSHPPITMMAETAKLIQSEHGPRFVLYHGSRQQVEKGKLSFLAFDEYAFDVSVFTNQAVQRTRQPDEMFIDELLFSDARGKEQSELQAEGHNRLTWPLLPVVFATLAASLLLTGELNRRGHWRRVTLIIGLGALVLCTNIGLLNLSRRYADLYVMMYVVNIGTFIISLWYMRSVPITAKPVRT